MINVQVSVSNFEQLTLEKQKEYLLIFLDGLKGLDPLFPSLMDTIKTSKYIESEQLISMYGDIMNFIKVLESAQKDEVFTNLKKHFDEMQKHEAEERAKESKEIETLISNI